MKKKTFLFVVLPIISVVLLVTLAVLFIPYNINNYNDGGTTEYEAYAYKVVKWKVANEDFGYYENTRWYFYPECRKSVNDLWEEERANERHMFVATVVQISDDSAIVEPVEGETERRSTDRISFSVKDMENRFVDVGETVEITYKGVMSEGDDVRITAISWRTTQDLRHLSYYETWFPTKDTEKIPEGDIKTVCITVIYKNCFFAYIVRSDGNYSGSVKFNTELDKKWCVGDYVDVKYRNMYNQGTKFEGDIVEVTESDIQPVMYYKPVIYLYPEQKTEVSVKLNLNGALTCTYPKYQGLWQVVADTDGTLTDKKGKAYNYLYWEGKVDTKYDMSKGFCVKGEDTAEFLEKALEKLGLTRREANEFIVFWLPLMEENPYNIISFQGKSYTDEAELEVYPKPDTMIRIFMTWQSSEEYIELEAQELTAPKRQGFVLVEWGGTEIE